MAIFRNINFTKRDHECTNVVAVVADTKPTFGLGGTPADYWVEADASTLDGLRQIGRNGGATFYGYL